MYNPPIFRFPYCKVPLVYSPPSYSPPTVQSSYYTDTHLPISFPCFYSGSSQTYLSVYHCTTAIFSNQALSNERLEYLMYSFFTVLSSYCTVLLLYNPPTVISAHSKIPLLRLLYSPTTITSFYRTNKI